MDSHLSDCSSSSRTPASQRRRQSWGETTTHVTVMKTIRSAGFLHPLLIFLLQSSSSSRPQPRSMAATAALSPPAVAPPQCWSSSCPHRRTEGPVLIGRRAAWERRLVSTAGRTTIIAKLPAVEPPPLLSNLCVSAGTRVAPNICAKTAAGTETRERDRRKTGGSVDGLTCAERRSINRVALLPPPTKQRFGLIRWRGVGPDEDKLGRPAQRGQGHRTRPSTPLVVHLSFSTCQVSLSSTSPTAGHAESLISRHP